MIDFRYHVVSIIAVFLALTIGLVIGATIVNQDAAKTLRAQITSVNNEKAQLQQSVRSMKATNGQLGAYIDETKAALVAGLLSGDAIVVVRLPGSDDAANKAVLGLIGRAQSTVTADITLNPTFTDASSVQQLADLVTNYAPAGQKPAGSGPVEQATALLAEALASGAGGSAGTAGSSPSPAPSATASAGASPDSSAATDDWAIRTIQAFADDGVITVNTMPTLTSSKPNAAYLAAPKGASNPQNPTYLALATALRGDGAGTVVGGWSATAASGGLISALLKNSAAAKTVFTVDQVDQPTGQVAVVFALNQAVAKPTRAAGHYGTTGSTDGLLPPMPSPSAS